MTVTVTVMVECPECGRVEPARFFPDPCGTGGEWHITSAHPLLTPEYFAQLQDRARYAWRKAQREPYPEAHHETPETPGYEQAAAAMRWSCNVIAAAVLPTR